MKKYLLLISILMFQFIVACSKFVPIPSNPNQVQSKNPNDSNKYTQNESKPSKNGYLNKSLEESLLNRYKNQVPKEWSEKAKGVKTKLDTKDKVVALTFDACGGLHGSRYDKALIDYLIKEKVPATLFINSRWIDANKNTFMELSKNNLFEIENHGYRHSPLSVNGRSEYGIPGTKGVPEIIEEVMMNENKIYEMTIISAGNQLLPLLLNNSIKRFTAYFAMSTNHLPRVLKVCFHLM